MYNGVTIDIGKGNLCAECHQPMAPTAVPVVGGADVAVTSAYWGLHHGPQGTIMGGTGGYEISGSASYENSAHTTMVTDGCPTCHMATPYGVQAGGHTMKMGYEYHGHLTPNTAGCESCHSGIESFDVNGTQTEVEELLAELKVLLLAEELVDETDHTVPGTYSADNTGCLMNYLMCLEDRSDGVHNPKYVKALLTNSIEALE